MTGRVLAALSRGSLTGRVLRGMVLPMGVLALLLGLGGALAIRSAVETVNDRILGAASRAIAESLTVDEGEIGLDLSPAIFGMLEDSERDNVYYSVREGERVVTGYRDLPNLAPLGLRDTEVRFGNGVYRGLPVRIVSEGRRISGLAQPVIVEVAETLATRQRIEQRLFIGLVLLEATLIGLTLLLLPIAVRWGMRPLTALRQEMDQRVAQDITPLPLGGVPVELRDLVIAFNGMLNRLDVTLQRMRQFTADTSHQLRTPLSILRTHIGVLRATSSDNATAAASLADIDHASARLQRLVIQLLALARAENAAPPEESLETVDANELAARVAADQAPEAVARDVELRFERARAPVLVRTQPLLAAELIGNLLDNAIRYNHAQGWVTIALERVSDGVMILIEDDGPGIAPEDRARALTRFSRLERDAARVGGSGLGLPIAEALAETLGVRLGLETATSGRGLLVRLWFPAGRHSG